MKIYRHLKIIKFYLGIFAKFFLKFFITKTSKIISGFGPFYLIPEYFFTNFKNWSSGHNSCYDICIDIAQNSKCFIDVGAHIGLVSLSASSVMPINSKIICFEPSKISLIFSQSIYTLIKRFKK